MGKGKDKKDRGKSRVTGKTKIKPMRGKKVSGKSGRGCHAG